MARSVPRTWHFCLLIVVVAGYYLCLLSNGTFQLFAPEMLDKAFGNMLVHLLQGEFTVDRTAIDFEAFTRNGNTYWVSGAVAAHRSTIHRCRAGGTRTRILLDGGGHFYRTAATDVADRSLPAACRKSELELPRRDDGSGSAERPTNLYSRVSVDLSRADPLVGCDGSRV